MPLNFFRRNKTKNWKSIEYFDEAWKNRIIQMTKYIPANSSVVDLGCGKMWTKDFLPAGCTYIPVDYIKRSEETIKCDFNKHEFPAITTDVSFVSGCLEYINDYRWFIKNIAHISDRCILSYCLLEYFPNLEERKSLTWVNNLNRKELITIFEENNFKIFKEEITATNNSIFIFIKE